MKKYIVGGLVGATLMFSAQGFAADAIEKVEAYIKNQPVKLNGQAVTLESPALVYDGSTYLKLRDAAKLTGLNVNWNEQTQTVELENTNTSTPQKPSGVNVPSQAQPAAPPSIPVKINKVLKFGETIESNGLAITFSNLRIEPATEPDDIKYQIDRNVYYDVTLEVKDPSIIKKGISFYGNMFDVSEIDLSGFSVRINDYLSETNTKITRTVSNKISKDKGIPNSVKIKLYGLDMDNVTWVAK